MKTINISNGIIHLAESKTQCPHCERMIPFDEIEDKFFKQKRHYIKFKCKCKRKIGITTDIRGDYRAFEL